jgi:hypothetical protein
MEVDEINTAGAPEFRDMVFMLLLGRADLHVLPLLVARTQKARPDNLHKREKAVRQAPAVSNCCAASAARAQ